MKWSNHQCGASLLMRYSRLLASHPYGVLLSVTFIFVALISLPFVTHKFPDFSDPQLGFESRQTPISSRLTAWDNLVEATRASGPLTFNPSDLYHSQEKFYRVQFSDGRRKSITSKGLGKKKDKEYPTPFNKSIGVFIPRDGEKVAHLKVDSEDYFDEEDGEVNDSVHILGGNNSSSSIKFEDFFCGDPSTDYGRVVLSSASGESLLSFGAIKAMCHLEHEILIGGREGGEVTEAYTSLCQTSKSGACCRPWSLSNYIAQLTNHSSCMDISETDVKYAVNILSQCGMMYLYEKSTTDCRDGHLNECQSPPRECVHNNWAYNIFHFLTDKDLSNLGGEVSDQKIPFLKYSVIFLPIACSTTSMAYYSAVKSIIPSSYNGIKVEAMELGLRDSLFDHHLIQDSWMLIGVAVAVGSVMWMYSRSLVIAVASILSIPLSLGLSYSAYKYVFRLSFFPFLNLVAAVISLGIGVDDAFIFCKMWKFLKIRDPLMRIQALDRDAKATTDLELNNASSFANSTVTPYPREVEAVGSADSSETNSGKSSRHEETNCEVHVGSSSCQYSIVSDVEGAQRNTLDSTEEEGGETEGNAPKHTSVDLKDVSYGPMDLLVCRTLKSAFQSMLVTSLTTAVAFYLSYLSKVTAIRCFSIFAGTAVITNFLLMLTWFPAAVIIAERMSTPNCHERCCDFCSERAPENLFVVISHMFPDKLRVVIQNYDKIFDIPKFWAWIFVISLGVISLLSVVIASYYPGLHPPNELQFQLLHSTHLFERYHLIFQPLFSFEQGESGRNEEPGVPLRFVFGVLPQDTGDPLDPTSRVPRGHRANNLHFDDDFDIASHEAQVWFLKFCQSVRLQSFYGSNSGPLLSNCFMETFKKWMSRRCIEPIDMLDRTPCCETSKFPFTRKVFRKCLLRALAQLYKTPHLLGLHRGESAGPRFLKTKPHKMVAAVVEYESNIPFTTSFTAMNHFYHNMEIWMEEQLKSAPLGLKCGWFVSNLHFYDLQATLSTGVLSGVCISLGVSAITLFVTTWNILQSLLTSLAIASATSVALAALSLLGWSLGPVESLTLSLAVGLSADFALHYAVSHQWKLRKSSGCHRICKSSKCIIDLYEYLTRKTDDDNCRQVQHDDVRDRCEDCEGDSGGVDAAIHMKPFVGVPATLAAITTVIAGLLMLPSSIVAYNQVGIFLIVLIPISWFYSTFFLLPLFRIFQTV
ncbi:protein dispatched homolog 1 [Ischnura elegans]|uniref:protein dispatched homolog 1 n=1 Tax=Ischnura elegans TaxID=197161 RepID=UPI001ED87218|nr:protein dispatched homolog 1 [Ischnura elegans]